MEKKILIVLFLSVLLVSLPPMVSAQSPTTEPEGIPDSCIIKRDPKRIGINNCPVPVGQECKYADHPECGVCCLGSTILYITDWIFVGLIAIVIVLVLLGAVDLLTAAGNADKITAGRNKIMWAAIGLAVALLAKTVPAFVRFILVPPSSP